MAVYHSPTQSEKDFKASLDEKEAVNAGSRIDDDLLEEYPELLGTAAETLPKLPSPQEPDQALDPQVNKWLDNVQPEQTELPLVESNLDCPATDNPNKGLGIGETDDSLNNSARKSSIIQSLTSVEEGHGPVTQMLGKESNTEEAALSPQTVHTGLSGSTAASPDPSSAQPVKEFQSVVSAVKDEPQVSNEPEPEKVVQQAALQKDFQSALSEQQPNDYATKGSVENIQSDGLGVPSKDALEAVLAEGLVTFNARLETALKEGLAELLDRLDTAMKKYIKDTVPKETGRVAGAESNGSLEAKLKALLAGHEIEQAGLKSPAVVVPV